MQVYYLFVSIALKGLLVGVLWIPFSRVALKPIPQLVGSNNLSALMFNNNSLLNTIYSEIATTSKCTPTCVFSEPLSAFFYVVIVHALAAVASYYTYRIRRFHKYFRQTRVLTFLLLCFLPSSLFNLLVLFMRHNFQPHLRWFVLFAEKSFCYFIYY